MRFYNDTDHRQCSAVDDQGLDCAAPEGHEPPHANINGEWVRHDHEYCITPDGVAPGCPDFDDDGEADYEQEAREADDRATRCTLDWPGTTCYCTRREGCRAELFADDGGDDDD